MLSQSLTKSADILVSQTKILLKSVETEEDLRISFEKILEPIKKELGIKTEAKYEVSVFRG
ncbi:MAG: hypothetical protein N2482_03620 [Patescibacteria group bacterium]|nr:hypothetical protein [Patescibacteria group bacterium]